MVRRCRWRHRGSVFSFFYWFSVLLEEVDNRLFNIMKTIHENCYRTAEKYGTPGNYVNGANIAGFLKVANAMMDQGLV